MKSALFILFLFIMLCSNVGVRWMIVEEDEKCFVYPLSFHHVVQQRRGAGAERGGRGGPGIGRGGAGAERL